MKPINLQIPRLLLTIAIFAVCVYPQTTEITYQGQLQNSSMPANGSFDFEFVLYDGGGSQIGPVNQRNGVAVAGGFFSVNLDFQSSFTGPNRFLEIRVRQSGGGAFTTLTPRQPVTSAPYSIKSLSADNAVNATNATTAATATNATTAGTAANFSGSLSGDVTGTQNATTVARIQNRNVASTLPLDGQVLKYNSAASQWVPGTDNTASGSGGGTITGVSAGTGLTGGGVGGNVTLAIANGGVGTIQLTDGSVTDAKITSVSGVKVTGTVANATNATTATNATQLGGVAANQYLQTNGNGSGVTNLNASSITTGTLANARLGQIPTANIANSAVTAPKIAAGQVVKTLNGLTDNVTLAGTGTITVTPTGNTLTIASTGGGGGVGGSGTANSVPVWNSNNTLSNSLITQSAVGVQLPNGVQLAAGAQGNAMAFGSPNGETGITFNGPVGRADVRFDGTNMRLLTGPAGGPPAAANGISISNTGDIDIGATVGANYITKLQSNGEANKSGITGVSQSGTGVNGISSGSIGVGGTTSTGTGVLGSALGSGGIAVRAFGTSWFQGDTTPLSTSNMAPGTGVAIGSSGNAGYIYAYDYGANQARNLFLNGPGGRVHIGPACAGSPDQILSVCGNASKIGGGSWQILSDERLKTINGRFTGGLKAVMKLQPLRYNYKTDNGLGIVDQGEHIGFSAQAVEKLIPEAVTKNEQGYRMLNNDPIMWTMLNAIKEQQAIIVDQQRQIDQLKGLTCRKNKKAAICKGINK